jgi:23S rRNA pseudouridine2605 synthase
MDNSSASSIQDIVEALNAIRDELREIKQKLDKPAPRNDVPGAFGNEMPNRPSRPGFKSGGFKPGFKSGFKSNFGGDRPAFRSGKPGFNGEGGGFKREEGGEGGFRFAKKPGGFKGKPGGGKFGGFKAGGSKKPY